MMGLDEELTMVQEFMNVVIKWNLSKHYSLNSANVILMVALKEKPPK